MALVSGQRGTNNQGAGVRKFDHADKLFLVDPDHAVLAFFARKLNKKSVTDPEFRWFDKAQPSRLDQVNNAPGYTAGDTAIVVDNGPKFRVGDIVMNITTGEHLRVTAVATNTLTISRAYGTTAAAAMVDNDFLIILGNANAEGAGVRASLTEQKTKRTNYTQIIREPFDVTGTLASTEVYAEADDLATLRREHLQVHLNDIERVSFFGEPKEDLSGSQPIRTTGGLRYWLSTNVTDAGGALTETEFESWIESVFAKGGDKKMGFLSPLIGSAVNFWAKGKLQMFPKDKTYGISISKYLSIHGELDFVVEKLFKENATFNGYGFAVDMSLIGYRYLGGNARSRDTALLKNRQAAGEDEIIEEYLTEYGFWLALENRHGYLKNVTSYS